MSQVDMERFRGLLLEERERVASAIEFLHEENPGSLEDETGEETQGDDHLADAATATHDREVDYTLEEDAEHVLRQIDDGARADRGRHVRDLRGLRAADRRGAARGAALGRRSASTTRGGSGR